MRRNALVAAIALVAAADVAPTDSSYTAPHERRARTRVHAHAHRGRGGGGGNGRGGEPAFLREMRQRLVRRAARASTWAATNALRGPRSGERGRGYGSSYRWTHNVTRTHKIKRVAHPLPAV